MRLANTSRHRHRTWIVTVSEMAWGLLFIGSELSVLSFLLGLALGDKSGAFVVWALWVSIFPGFLLGYRFALYPLWRALDCREEWRIELTNAADHRLDIVWRPSFFGKYVAFHNGQEVEVDRPNWRRRDLIKFQFGESPAHEAAFEVRVRMRPLRLKSALALDVDGERIADI